MNDIHRSLDHLEQAVQTFARPPSANAGDDLLAFALRDIARHYGIETSVTAVVAGLPLVDGKLPVEHFDGAARRAGLVARTCDADPLKLSDVELPAIILTPDGSVDVIWAIERDRSGTALHATISPAGRKDLTVRLPAAELAVAGYNRAVHLMPAANQDQRGFEGVAPRQESWFLPAFAWSKSIYAEAIAATIAINVLALALPLFTMNIYDRVLPNAAAETLWSLSIGVILATAFDFLIKVLRGNFVDTAGCRAEVVLSNLIYSRLIGAKADGPAVSAGVRANTMRELDTLREFYNSATLTLFGDLPFLLLFLGVIAVVAGWLVAIPLIAIPIVLGVAWITQRGIGRLMETSIRQTAIKNAVVVETMVGLESIKTAGAESWAASQWEKATAESIRTSNQLKHRSNLGIYAIYTLQTLTQVAMIVVGFYMAAAGNLTMGGLIAATMLAGRAMQPLAQVAVLISKLHQTRLSYRLLDDIVRAPQERADNAKFVHKPHITGAVTFADVKFRYEPDSRPALDGVSFTIAPGERVGLIGGIGTGKTTALKLIQGLHEPGSGRVLVDGIPVHHYDPAELRSEIGLALQHTELFYGTIRSNITLGQPGISEAALLEAATAAGALDWIVTQPKGLEAVVRERGAGLSGGQRQTIVLARALARAPRVLLLDEPTSDLDPSTEQVVVERLNTWLQGRTAVIVTHRPAMLALVNRLIVFEGGRVKLDGPKTSVLAALSASTKVAVSVAAPRRPS